MCHRRLRMRTSWLPESVIGWSKNADSGDDANSVEPMVNDGVHKLTNTDLGSSGR